jgi:hypothetical protein
MRFKHLHSVFPVAVLFFIIFSFASRSAAQVPTTQDCKGAVAVCDYIYQEDSTANGFGNYYEIPTGQNCGSGHCMDGEKNSRWYVFTVVESGQLRFEITPTTSSDDYDWAVFNITTYSCDDIKLHPNWMMRSCNAAGGSGYQGATGINTLNGGNSNCNNGGFTNKWNADLSVFQGETYVLVVSDWTQTPGGYTLDFTASSAVIFDDQAPFIDYIGADLITECGGNELLFRFNEKVKCASVDVTDFTVSGPGGPFTIDSLYGETCSLGGDPNEKEYTLYVTPPFTQGGDYELKINAFSYISDACDNYALPDTYPFVIDLESPDADAGEDQTINYGTVTTLEGGASGGSGDYTYHWEPEDMLVDPDAQNPTTVNLTSNTDYYLTVTDNSSNCTSDDTVNVYVEGGMLNINITASANAVCLEDKVELFSNPGGGSGNYTYAWTSDPEGFNSTLENPVDYPTQTTTYYLDVFDGFTHATDEITITLNPKPTADAGADQIINPGTPTSLTGIASGGSGSNYHYHWEPAGYLIDNEIQNPNTRPLYNPTVFLLMVTDGNGCVSNEDDVLVNPAGDALASVIYASPQKICYGESTTITTLATGGGGQYTYSWKSTPEGFASTESSFTVSPQVNTIYHLTLTDQYDNEVEEDIEVTVYALPEIDLIPPGITPVEEKTITVCVRDSVLMDAGQEGQPEGTEFFWIGTGSQSRYYKAITNGNLMDVQKHKVRVTHPHDNFTCSNTDSLTIIFSFKECGTGTEDHFIDMTDMVKVVPNPNTGSFNLRFEKPAKQIQVSVYTIEGRIIFKETGKESFRKGDEKQLDLNLAKGVYFVHISSGPNSTVRKVVVN